MSSSFKHGPFFFRWGRRGGGGGGGGGEYIAVIAVTESSIV